MSERDGLGGERRGCAPWLPAASSSVRTRSRGGERAVRATEHRALWNDGVAKITSTLKADGTLHRDGARRYGVLWMTPVGVPSLATLCNFIARGFGDEDPARLPYWD